MLPAQRDRLNEGRRYCFGRFFAFFSDFLACGSGGVPSILRSTSSALGWGACRGVFTFSISPLYIVPEESEAEAHQMVTEVMVEAGTQVIENSGLLSLDVNGCADIGVVVKQIFLAMQSARDAEK